MRWLRAVIFLLLILLSASQAHSETVDACHTYLTPTQSYASLMQNRQLLPQHHLSLYKKRLLLKNGGLCTSTCGINAIQALFNMSGRPFFQSSASLLKLMLDFLKIVRHVDGRRGLTLDELKSGLYFLADGIHFPISVTVDRFEHTDQLTPQHDEILLAMVADEEPHAVVVMGPDEMNLWLYFSDPNAPNTLGAAPMSTFETYAKEVMRIRMVTDRAELQMREHIGRFGRFHYTDGEKEILYVSDIIRDSGEIYYEVATSLESTYLELQPFKEVSRIDDINPDFLK